MGDSCEETHRQLGELALRDPKQARRQICALLDTDSPLLTALLHRMSLPGEGRLRHLLANAVRLRSDKGKVVGFLAEWLETETDEFAKRAIAAALSDVDRATFQKPPPQALLPPGLVEGYRHATARLSHKLRNSLEAPHAQILRLRTRVGEVGDPGLRSEMLDLLAKLQDGFSRVGRIVELDPTEDWFCLRIVQLAEWLRNMNVAYARLFRPVRLDFDPIFLAERTQIHASDYLLDAIFWNLWNNAQQIIGEDCHITIRVEHHGDRALLTVLDNGDGFDPSTVEIAFRERFTTRGRGRGRGLLEVQAAAEDLQVTASLRRQESGDHRVMLSFPLAKI